MLSQRLLLASGAVQNNTAKVLGTTPNWILQIRKTQQCGRSEFQNSRDTKRNAHSYYHNRMKRPFYVFQSPVSKVNRTAALNTNDHEIVLCFNYRSCTTTTDDEKRGENDKSHNEEKSLQMPDKDVELQLAGLQATITEEYKRGNFTRALTSSQDLLKQTQQHFGYNVDHPATASAMNNVGLMHKLLGNFTEARQHYVGAMRIYASVCGRDHASYAMTLHNLGNLNKSQVHFDVSLKATERLSLVEAAMEYLEEAYDIRVAELGAEHPHTVATRSAIGSTLATQVLYQHKLVENTSNKSSQDHASGSNTQKQYVALNPEGITQQQWRAAEEHLRISLQTAIDNPRGKQIQNKKDTKNERKGRKGKKQNVKHWRNSDESDVDSSSNVIITTLSAASAAQNLAVFLKSRAMTFDEESQERKQHMYEAKGLYEQVQEVRTQLLPYDHPDLYATKYSLAELLEVLAATPSSTRENANDEEEQGRERHQEIANALRQEIIDTYDPPDSKQQQEEVIDSETKTGLQDVVVEKTQASKN